MTADIALAKGGRSLWEEQLLLDYTIEVEDEKFKVHKFVLASVSDYFRAMLTGGMVESREDRVKLQGFSSGVVSDIINFIYTGQLVRKSIASLKEFLDCAVYLQISAAIEKCSNDLCQKVDENNCFDILSIFKSYSLENGIEFTKNYIKSNIDTILETHEADNMSHHDLLNLIDCWERCEWNLFVIINKWTSADHENRKEHVNDLMTRMRFCLMTPAEINCVKDLDLFSDSDTSWHDLVEEALTYHNLPIHQKVLDDSVQTQVRTESAAVLATDPESAVYTLQQDSHNSAWQRCNDVNAPNVMTSCMPNDVLEANNFLIVSDHPDHNWYIFDPRTLAWSMISQSEIFRHGFASVYHDKHLFALGGWDFCHDSDTWLTDAIEKYDFETDAWELISSRMPVALIHHSVFSITGSIFVLGGWSQNMGDNFLARVDCFHPSSGTWEAKSPILETGKFLESRIQVLELFGEKMITVFDKDLSLQYYKPSTDQWSIWRHLGVGRSRLSCDYRGRVVARGNCLFIMNFMRGRAEGACGKWTFCDSGLERVDRLPDVRNVFRPYMCLALNMTK